MFTCTTCDLTKSEKEFHKSKRTKSGVQSTCKSCRKIIDAESYRKSPERRAVIRQQAKLRKENNRRFISRYKSFCKCASCGESEPAALDLHHLDASEKDHDPSTMLGFSLENIKKEIRKCVVLCANCHRKVHAGILKL